MASTIFEDCSFSVEDVKKLYMGSRQLNGNVITFPIEYTTFSGTSDSIIRVQEWSDSGNYALLGNQYIEWREIANFGDNIVFNENYEEGRQGKTYVKNLEFQLPSVNFTTNAALKEFIFSAGGNFAISNAVAFIIDGNDQQWLVGYDLPLVLDDGMEISIAGENYYRLSYKSVSYSRTRNYTIDA